LILIRDLVFHDSHIVSPKCPSVFPDLSTKVKINTLVIINIRIIDAVSNHLVYLYNSIIVI
jgi:hypothetical protein